MGRNRNLFRKSVILALALGASLALSACAGGNSGSNNGNSGNSGGNNGNSGNSGTNGTNENNGNSSGSVTTFKKGQLSQGDVVTFGSFEQDNDTSNGTEPIEWIVLNVDQTNDQALLLSKKALDTRKYHDDHGTLVRMTWAECDLRFWLNGEFYSDAFSSKEKKKIIHQFIENHNNPQFSTAGGDQTKDYVFLLSIEEVTDPANGFSSGYSDEDVARACAATPYAVSRGAQTSPNYPTADGEEGCFWWLRSPGGTPTYAAAVLVGDMVSVNGAEYGADGYGVRPAIYVKLEK